MCMAKAVYGTGIQQSNNLWHRSNHSLLARIEAASSIPRSSKSCQGMIKLFILISLPDPGEYYVTTLFSSRMKPDRQISSSQTTSHSSSSCKYWIKYSRWLQIWGFLNIIWTNTRVEVVLQASMKYSSTAAVQKQVRVRKMRMIAPTITYSAAYIRFTEPQKPRRSGARTTGAQLTAGVTIFFVQHEWWYASGFASCTQLWRETGKTPTQRDPQRDTQSQQQ